LQANEHDRAEQLRGVIERLGPAYVKVAQAMSTRIDLLSPEYYMQIQLLQDRVPPFPCDQAKEVRTGVAQLLLRCAMSSCHMRCMYDLQTAPFNLLNMVLDLFLLVYLPLPCH
jgi:hypothetical protein